jgi:predicted O-methyltransferase YrrM
MKKLWLTYSFLKYRLNAKTRYKIHSPFVYDLIETVFRDKTKYPDYSKLDKVHRRYARRKDQLDTIDFGSGSGKKEYVEKKTTVGKLVKSRTHSKKQLEFLFRIARHFKPETILEFGTAAGISTLYIAKGSPESRLITMEGCMGLASVARKSFKKREVVAEVEVGDFTAILNRGLKDLQKLDMVFFDGNHRKKPTIEYFERCMEFATENSIFMFDDIHWSRGMSEAWQYIKNDKRVSLTIDLFWIGLVFFKSGVAKQDFVIRY